MTGGYSDSYQQTEQQEGQGAYDPSAGYSAAATYQQPAATAYEPEPDTGYTTSRVPRGPSFSSEGMGRGLVLVLVVIGIIILLVARIYAAGLIKIDYTDDDAGEKIESITYNTTVMNALAIALVSMGLMIGAIALEGLGTHVRSGLAIAAGIIIGLAGFLPVIS
jgi:hypothetical protein